MGTDSRPEVTVVIPTKDRWELLHRAALRAALLQEDVALEASGFSYPGFVTYGRGSICPTAVPGAVAVAPPNPNGTPDAVE